VKKINIIKISLNLYRKDNVKLMGWLISDIDEKM
jgi:hypothetical protein